MEKPFPFSTFVIMSTMVDKYGRTVNYLRLAVTDRCNLRCQYCMPAEGIDYVPQKELLRYEEMLRICKVLSNRGISKLRITGGEPFVRKDMMDFLKAVKKQSALKSLHITTNGSLCLPHLDQIASLGLDSINLSLDTLDPQRFFAITRRDAWEATQKVLEAFLEMDVRLKINMVVMSGINEMDILPMALLAKDHAVEVRFIEEMPFNGGSNRQEKRSWSAENIHKVLSEHLGSLESHKMTMGSTAQLYSLKDFKGQLGIIPAFSRTFCSWCNRIRITAMGQLKTCLYDQGVFDLKAFMRSGASDQMLADTIQEALNYKALNGFEAERRRGGSQNRESMSTIGG